MLLDELYVLGNLVMKRELITERPIKLTVVWAMHAYSLGERAMIFCGYMLN